MSYLRYFCLFTYSVVYHILCCVFVLLVFVFMYPMLSVSLDCPVSLAPSVFYDIYLYIDI
jgi:hypothetical protein